MTTRIAIDPNVRVRGNDTYSGFEDVAGELAVGADVEVFVEETELVGQGRIAEIDPDRRLVYLSVDWSSLAERDVRQTDSQAANLSPSPLVWVGSRVRDLLAARTALPVRRIRLLAWLEAAATARSVQQTVTLRPQSRPNSVCMYAQTNSVLVESGTSQSRVELLAG